MKIDLMQISFVFCIFKLSFPRIRAFIKVTLTYITYYEKLNKNIFLIFLWKTLLFDWRCFDHGMIFPSRSQNIGPIKNYQSTYFSNLKFFFSKLKSATKFLIWITHFLIPKTAKLLLRSNFFKWVTFFHLLNYCVTVLLF